MVRKVIPGSRRSEFEKIKKYCSLRRQGTCEIFKDNRQCCPENCFKVDKA